MEDVGIRTRAGWAELQHWLFRFFPLSSPPPHRCLFGDIIVTGMRE